MLKYAVRLALFSPFKLCLSSSIKKMRLASYGSCTMSTVSEMMTGRASSPCNFAEQTITPTLANTINSFLSVNLVFLHGIAEFLLPQLVKEVNSSRDINVTCCYCHLLIHSSIIPYSTLIMLLLLFRLLTQFTPSFLVIIYLFRFRLRPFLRAPPNNKCYCRIPELKQ